MSFCRWLAGEVAVRIKVNPSSIYHTAGSKGLQETKRAGPPRDQAGSPVAEWQLDTGGLVGKPTNEVKAKRGQSGERRDGRF